MSLSRPFLSLSHKNSPSFTDLPKKKVDLRQGCETLFTKATKPCCTHMRTACTLSKSHVLLFCGAARKTAAWAENIPYTLSTTCHCDKAFLLIPMCRVKVTSTLTRTAPNRCRLVPALLTCKLNSSVTVCTFDFIKVRQSSQQNCRSHCAVHFEDGPGSLQQLGKKDA